MARSTSGDHVPGVTEEQSEGHILSEHLRPMWNPSGMVCHVPECPRKDVISTLQAFTKHWDKFHTRFVTMRTCSRCGKIGKDNNDIRRHIAATHRYNTSDISISSVILNNRLYINPRVNLPARRLSTDREMARQAAMCQRHDLRMRTRAPITVPRNTVARDEEAVVHFNSDGSTRVSVRFRSSKK